MSMFQCSSKIHTHSPEIFLCQDLYNNNVAKFGRSVWRVYAFPLEHWNIAPFPCPFNSLCGTLKKNIMEHLEHSAISTTYVLYKL